MTLVTKDRDHMVQRIKDAYYHGRDSGGTMHTSAEDAANSLLASGAVVTLPDALRALALDTPSVVILRSAVLDPGTFTKRRRDDDGYEHINSWQYRAMQEALRGALPDYIETKEK